MLVSITKSDEQSPPGRSTHPRSLGQETLRIALAHTKTPTLVLREPNSQLRRKATPARGPSRARDPHSDDHQSIPRTPAEPSRIPNPAPLPGPSLPAPSRPPPAPGRARDTESPRSFRPSPSIVNPTPDDLHPPYPPRYPPPPPSPNDGQPKSPPTLARRNQKKERQGPRSPKRTPATHPSPTQKEGQRRAPPPTGGRIGGSGGIRVSPPRKSTASPRRGA